MRRNMSLLENIFSVKNSDLNHKQICLLGFKIKWHKEAKPRYAYEDLPIENNKIIFRTFNGGYNCNPKYIAEEIIRQNLPYKLVWVVNKNILNFIDDFPRDKIKLVMSGTPEEVKETATAKIIVDNERRTSYINRGIFKKPDQIYIQTFHGSLGIKKTGVDRNDASKKALRICKIDSSQIDYLVSNSAYTTNFFKSMFWNYGTVIECGHPRNDIFFKDNKEVKKKVYNYFKIPANKKIIMYAPTLRGDGDLSCYSLNLEQTAQAVAKKFGGDWIIITRLHPLLINRREEFMPIGSNIIDGTSYSDMQELLASVDVLITDYSSSIYDYVLSYKPGFIYATDIAKYDNDRGLYYPLTSTPFPVATNNDEMIKNIQDFNYDKYKSDVTEFLKGKRVVEKGQASEKIVELIKNIITNAENKNKQEVGV